MIENESNAVRHSAVTITRPKKVLRMVQNDRMGGSVPMWEKPVSARQKTEERLTTALTGQTEKAAAPETALAYNAPPPEPTAPKEQEFGFADLIDMANPLHHIPVVGSVYREVTGDDIKPIAQIIGGSLFGGPVGAASSLVNIVVKEETGKDLAGNAMAMITRGEKPNFKSEAVNALESPEKRLNQIINKIENSGNLLDLPGALLSFTDLSNNHYRSMRISENQINPRPDVLKDTPAKELITRLELASIQSPIRQHFKGA